MKTKDIIILSLLILILFLVNYRIIDSFLIETFDTREEVFVDRVIDGDTIKTEGESIRLLGINAPERGEEFYEESKKFLEEQVLNKTVLLEYGKIKYDKYKRILAYVFVDNKNINLGLVEEGLANPYFPSGKDKYYSAIKDAWEDCVDNDMGICEQSENECVVLEEFDNKKEIIILKNICPTDIDMDGWYIKDEGRKKFYFSDFNLEADKTVQIIVEEGEDNKETLFWRDENYVWTKTGDTLFLRDKDNKLVLWESY